METAMPYPVSLTTGAADPDMPTSPEPAPSPEIEPAGAPEEAPIAPAQPDDGRPYD